MKLAAKMLLPPTVALAAVLAIGLGGNMQSLREVVKTNEANQQRNEVFMTMVSVQTQVGEMHAQLVAAAGQGFEGDAGDGTLPASNAVAEGAA